MRILNVAEVDPAGINTVLEKTGKKSKLGVAVPPAVQ
jgi:hypothetical protein